MATTAEDVVTDVYDADYTNLGNVQSTVKPHAGRDSPLEVSERAGKLEECKTLFDEGCDHLNQAAFSNAAVVFQSVLRTIGRPEMDRLIHESGEALRNLEEWFITAGRADASESLFFYAIQWREAAFAFEQMQYRAAQTLFNGAEKFQTMDSCNAFLNAFVKVGATHVGLRLLSSLVVLPDEIGDKAIALLAKCVPSSPDLLDRFLETGGVHLITRAAFMRKSDAMLEHACVLLAASWRHSRTRNNFDQMTKYDQYFSETILAFLPHAEERLQGIAHAQAGPHRAFALLVHTIVTIDDDLVEDLLDTGGALVYILTHGHPDCRETIRDAIIPFLSRENPSNDLKELQELAVCTALDWLFSNWNNPCIADHAMTITCNARTEELMTLIAEKYDIVENTLAITKLHPRPLCLRSSMQLLWRLSADPETCEANIERIFELRGEHQIRNVIEDQIREVITSRAACGLLRNMSNTHSVHKLALHREDLIKNVIEAAQTHPADWLLQNEALSCVKNLMDVPGRVHRAVNLGIVPITHRAMSMHRHVLEVVETCTLLFCCVTDDAHLTNCDGLVDTLYEVFQDNVAQSEVIQTWAPALRPRFPDWRVFDA